MTKDELIEKIINDGIAIANKIKAAKTVEEVKVLKEDIDKYADFFDDNFDSGDDDFTMMIYMAAEEKIRQLEYYPEQNKNGNESADAFLDALQSKYWTKYEQIIAPHNS